MKKITFTLLALLFLVSCNPMTNEQIITEKDKCIKAGMDYEIIMQGNTALKVYCIKPKQAVQPL